MITVDISMHGGPVTTKFVPGMTAESLVQKLKEENDWRFKGNWTLQDVHDLGRVMLPTDAIMDTRYYYLTAWLEKADA